MSDLWRGKIKQMKASFMLKDFDRLSKVLMLFSGEVSRLDPSPSLQQTLPIRQIYGTWTPSGFPPLSRLASFESWELQLSANLHTWRELVIQMYSRLIFLPKIHQKHGEGNLWKRSWGANIRDLLKYAFVLSVYPEENIVGTVWYNICELDVKDQSDI